MAAAFYAWQIAKRIFLVYATVAKACAANPRVMPALLKGMAIGLSFEACDAIWERFVLGILQVGGTLGHENFLGLMSHFVTFPWLALWLAGEPGWWPIIVAIGGATIVTLTVSRATVGLAGIGFAGLFLLSALRRWTSRKALILALGVVSFCVLTPIVLSSFDQRFQNGGPTSDYDERAAFVRAAEMMITDYPLGVGKSLNNYVVAANTGATTNVPELPQ